MTIGTMTVSDCDVHNGAQAQGKGLPEGKFQMSACGVCDGTPRSLTVCCGDLPAVGAVPGSGVRVILCVTCAARDGICLEGPSRGSTRDVPLLLSLITIFERIWVELPLISEVNHFELADFPQ